VAVDGQELWGQSWENGLKHSTQHHFSNLLLEQVKIYLKIYIKSSRIWLYIFSNLF